MISLSRTSILSILTLSVLLTACEGDSGGSGTISLNITDAPVDSAARVVVSFSGVSIKPENGHAYDIDFIDGNGEPLIKTIDLLSQQGADSEPLLVNHRLDAGQYNWIRLKVITSQTTTDSYIELDGGAQYPLYVPSGDQTGLKLNHGFEITDGGAAALTIDFDLRKSVVLPDNGSNAYKLKPTLRIVNNENVGHISGVVGASTLSDVSCSTSPEYAVYVFSGSNITPDDIDAIDPDPVSTSLLSSNFEYAVGFLDEGNYTIAFTCQASDDTTEISEIISFIGTDNVTVIAGSTAIHNFN